MSRQKTELTLFASADANSARLFDSLEKLRALPDDLVVYSGHDYGAVPFRTLGEEKVMNPEFSQEFITRLRN